MLTSRNHHSSVACNQIRSPLTPHFVCINRMATEQTTGSVYDLLTRVTMWIIKRPGASRVD